MWPKMNMNIYGGLLGEVDLQKGGERKERMLRGEENQSMLLIYTYKDIIIKPTKHGLKRGRMEIKWRR
jgi:hypothetical protein